MTPEHYQLIISDLYEENYKSDFAKDLKENINDLTDFDWTYQYQLSNRVGGSPGSASVVGGGSVGSGVGGFSTFFGANVGGSTVFILDNIGGVGSQRSNVGGER